MSSLGPRNASQMLDEQGRMPLVVLRIADGKGMEDGSRVARITHPPR